MGKLILKYGFISGLTISFFMLISGGLMGDLINPKYGELLGYSSMIIALSAVFVGVKSYRDKSKNGSLSFLEGLKIGVLITVVASMCYVITWMIYSSTEAGKEMMEVYLNYSENELNNSNLPIAEIEAKRQKNADMINMYNNNPWFKAGITFLEIFPVGLIMSLLSSFILKRKLE